MSDIHILKLIIAFSAGYLSVASILNSLSIMRLNKKIIILEEEIKNGKDC